VPPTDSATRVASPPTPLPLASRYSDVSRVLVRVLALNLVVAVAKIAFGYSSGAISILSDGFHSLADTASNIVGLVGVRAAKQPPDDDHPYGHRKYETVAAAAVTGFLIAVVLEVLRNAFNNLSGRSAPPDIGLAGFVIMIVTIAINLFVVRYESNEARRLQSEILLADATQTRGDVWTSLAVIVALIGARAGVPILDPIAALIVAGFIGRAGFEIASTTTRILSDRIAMPEADIEEVVMSVDGVLGCHRIRTRGSSDHVFLDLHVWMAADMRLVDAHAISHVVKDRLMAQYPQITDAVIHLEPPPPPDRRPTRGDDDSSAW
jgi:cation diffusion facilitator family transporter